MSYTAVGAIVVNESTGLYHPVYFRPLIDQWDGENSIEYRSTLLHMEGFTDMDEAVREMRELCTVSGWTPSLNLFAWDGNGNPDLRSEFGPIPTYEEARARRAPGP
jgi:hypothetical protein